MIDSVKSNVQIEKRKKIEVEIRKTIIQIENPSNLF